MDAFESVVATVLERQGFWMRTSFKVELTKDEKQAIGKSSSPRWELDVVAYRPGDNLLQVVECKSFLNSRGVSIKGFRPGTPAAKRYKLFNETKTREVVLQRLVTQLWERKSIRKQPKVQLCLAAGKIVASEVDRIQQHFDANGWWLIDPDWLRKQLHAVADDGYDNSVAAVTAKLLRK